MSRIGIPNFDVLIKGCCDEQPGIHRIPNCRRNGELVAILVLLVHKQYVPVLRYEADFVLGRVPHIEYSGRPIRCPGEQVPPLCQINLTISSDYRHQRTRLQIAEQRTHDSVLITDLMCFSTRSARKSIWMEAMVNELTAAH